MAGGNKFFPSDEFPYPNPLIEIGQKTVIELVIENLSTLNDKVFFIFVVQKSDCQKYHLDNTLNLITKNNCEIIQLDGNTKGAACSALMAIDTINNDLPLIIANSDQIFDCELNTLVAEFSKADAGVPVFTSVHPRWSYARTDECGSVIECSEKNPISKNAIAGFYYFSKGSTFVSAAMDSIEKGAEVNGLFYVAPVLNEIVLNGGKISSHRIKNDEYHTLYTPQKITEYELSLTNRY